MVSGPHRCPQTCTPWAKRPGLLFPRFRKRVLAKSRRHPKTELGEAIEVWSHSLKMPASFRFDEEPDRAHTTKSDSGGPSAGGTVVQDHERIRQGTGQVKRAAFSRTKFGVVVIGSSPSDLDPGLAKVRNLVPPHAALGKLLLYLEGDDDLAKQKRQQLKTAQPVQVDQRRRIRDGFRHGWIATLQVRGPALPGFLGRR